LPLVTLSIPPSTVVIPIVIPYYSK
jgi:hypothetical protein